MDLNYTAEEEAFRQEVRTFLQVNLRPSLAEKVRDAKRLTREDLEEWHNLLNSKGWLA